ncbi:hypothetical protein [Stenomitos frigidus]
MSKERGLNNIGHPHGKGLAFGRVAFGYGMRFYPNAKPLQNCRFD